MAKIIVTAYPGPYQEPVKRIIEADICEFEQSHGGGTHVILEHGGFTIKESIEEVCKLINEAEAQETNKKLDEIRGILKGIERKVGNIWNIIM